MALRELLNADSLEARYGAVRSLTEMNKNDPALNTVRFENRFVLRQIKSTSGAAVHLTRRRIPEVTVFDTDQELLLPAILNAGHRIRVMGQDGEETVQIARYRVGEETVRRTCSRRLIDILKTVGELGAAYPDIVQLMIEAERQKNLAGELGIDRLPQSGRSYENRSNTDSSGSKSGHKVGSAAQMPGIFDRLDDEDSDEPVESLDLTTLTRPEKQTDSTEIQPATASELPADVPTTDQETSQDVPDEAFAEDVGQRSFDTDEIESAADDDEASEGLLKRFLKAPFAQHSF